MRLLFSFLLCSCCCKVFAGRITGVIRDSLANPLAYATITIKHTTLGTIANKDGIYSIDVDEGEYVVVAQHVGYERQEKRITVGTGVTKLDFKLSLLNLTMQEVVITPNGEDPAYAIIREAIKKREYYLNQVDQFRCEVYIKGQLQLRDYPKKFMGQTVDFEDGDTSKRKMVYLSETVATYSVDRPNKVKIDVTSTKVSGQSDGYGFSTPQIISFYENHIHIGRGLNPRGFLSPIADNALNFYNYRYEGSFIEDGKEINSIKVIPKRKFEPLFQGTIHITENDWRIHSLQLELTRESQMQLVDTLRIDQLYVPLTQDVWVIKTQVLYPAIKIFGFDAFGSFVNVYSKFEVNPSFASGYFGNTILKFEEGSNKKPEVYWDSVRPVELHVEEAIDYQKKDSLEKLRTSPEYLDSIDKKRNRNVSLINALLTGTTVNRQTRKSTFSTPSGTDLVKYNTVEGVVFNPTITWTKMLDSMGERRLSITPNVRYGFSNKHFNAFVSTTYSFANNTQQISVSGGKRVFQFNNNSVQSDRAATLSALLFERNWRKIYEAWYGSVSYERPIAEGLRLSLSAQFQDRMPLENTSFYTFFDREHIAFTPNYPIDLMRENFTRHQALIGTVSLHWQPGMRYIEFPGRKLPIGSKYPTFALSYVRGIPNLLGSDVDYDRWRFAVRGDLNMKLAGVFRYHVSTGGFISKRKIQVQDYYHINSNQSIFAQQYVNSFQLARHYRYSNTARLFTEFHAEHHFNGLLTNKIPVLRRLNWHLVAGANAFYANPSNHYYEVFAGIENIFKLVRIDYVVGRHSDGTRMASIKLGIRGITGQGRPD